MKEERYFYTPDVDALELPKDEAQHALRVLRLGTGDELRLMDGKGSFYRAEITTATGHRCSYRIVETLPLQRAWSGHLHLALAPTKLNDRTEWLAEKATEIGFDRLSLLDCQYSERRVMKSERLDKIVVSAMKQSHKAWKPEVGEMTPFRKFVEAATEEQRYICHCYDQNDITAEAPQTAKPHLFDVVEPGKSCLVMIGPEGDFSIDEVRFAEAHGFRSVTLGQSRLRTETAALVAVHIMHLKNTL